MVKIAHVREVAALQLPEEVIAVVREAVTVLDTEYGANRAADSGYGGYVLVIESEEDFARLKEIHLEVEKEIPEYVHSIVCSDGQVFSSSLFLLGSDFGVVVIIPLFILPSGNGYS